MTSVQRSTDTHAAHGWLQLKLLLLLLVSPAKRSSRSTHSVFSVAAASMLCIIIRRQRQVYINNVSCHSSLLHLMNSRFLPYIQKLLFIAIIF